MSESRIQRRIRRAGPWGQLASDVQIVISSNVGGGRALSAEGEARPRASEDPPEGHNRPNERRTVMSESEYRKLTREDLDRLAGEALPERAAMSLVNANLAIPVNAAIAANVLSDGSIAYADATQQTPIDQGNLTGP